MSSIDPSIAIFVLASVYVAFTVALNKLTGSRDRMRFLQKQMSDFQKELKEAAAANDEKRVRALSVREKEVTGGMMEMMWLPWKSLVFILPVFFLLIGTSGLLGIQYDGLLKQWFPDFVITLPFGLHVNELFSFRIFSPSVYGSRGFFIVCAVFAGILLETIVSRLEKRGENKLS